ncbi:hypothetical protein [Mycoplasmopsis gallinacea]|uniref:Uncharacterized protein n=1 Tax=Mycoplasmopsis gallinacea TaxID=29556 RepID=A0A6H0V2F9_9BACT|nr:hypothetical protein [Mycoplasmopsis gallinacea]QIW62530.1 hypothetical protein GOQ20_03870 [Mycoplasmopsis gallinacea]
MKIKEDKNLINETDFMDFVYEPIKVTFWGGEEKTGYLTTIPVKFPLVSYIARYMLLPFEWSTVMPTVFAWEMVKQITDLKSNIDYKREKDKTKWKN